MSDDSTISQRDDLRNRQLRYAEQRWVRHIGDRVQFYHRYGDIEPWTEATITDLVMEQPPCTSGLLIREQLTVVTLSDGRVVKDGEWNCYPMHLVPHEDYFNGTLLTGDPQHE